MADLHMDAQKIQKDVSPMPASGRRGRKGPLVSVLLPTYNRRRYLPHAIKSVLDQTYSNLEVFVIRDGGEDVADIVGGFNDPRVVFIDRCENRGKPYSLNEALRRAQGTYVAYLDDDDIYYPYHVQVLVDALERQTDCPVAYSDLYRVYCNVLPDGRRQILGKFVEVSRDFDRFMMFYFNHVLHVSLMHRRELLDRTGPYNEDLNVLIDWDITRRLAFFADFHHVYTVTGEFYCPVEMCDRISVQRRLDDKEYLRNVMTIRSSKPPKPWPKVKELSIIVAADRVDQEFGRTLMGIWQHTFYPYHVYVALPSTDIARLSIEMPDVTVVPAPASSTVDERVDLALERADGAYAAVVPGRGVSIEERWLEHAVHALTNNGQGRTGYLIEDEGSPVHALVVTRGDLVEARRSHRHLSVEDSLAACGIDLRAPQREEYPFQFDDLIREAKWAEVDGDWNLAGKLFELAGRRHNNRCWMMEMAAKAYFEVGDYNAAARLSRQVNGVRPTVETLFLEALIHRKRGQDAHAIELLTQAEQWLAGGAEIPVSAAEPLRSIETSH